MRLLAGKNLGTIATAAFVDGIDNNDEHFFEYRRVNVDHWEQSPEARKFRDARLQRGISLRECARLMGLTAEQLSGLETGRYRPENWQELFDLLTTMPGKS